MKTEGKKKRRSSLCQLLQINEEILIEQVAVRPTIYDRSLKSYRKAASRNQCWDEISAIVDAPAEICRRKWRSLRDSFGKHYKMTQKIDSSTTTIKHRKWIFYDKMTFLIPFMDNVSIELDKMLDELEDLSDESQSNDCERMQINSNIETQNGHPEKNAIKSDKQNEIQNNDSVSLQDTDYMQITMENQQQQQQQQQQLPPQNDIHMTIGYTHRNDSESFGQRPRVINSATPTNIALLQQQPQQDQIQQNTNNIDNNAANCFGPARLQSNFYNRNNSGFNMQYGDNNADNYAFILDSDEKFLLSCAPTLRRMTRRQNSLARLKIQQILYDIEFRQENN